MGDEIQDLAGTPAGYVGVTDELSLVNGVRDATANHEYLPIGEWPLLSPANVDDEGGDGDPSGPEEDDNAGENTGEGES